MSNTADIFSLSDFHVDGDDMYFIIKECVSIDEMIKKADNEDALIAEQLKHLAGEVESLEKHLRLVGVKPRLESVRWIGGKGYFGDLSKATCSASSHREKDLMSSTMSESETLLMSKPLTVDEMRSAEAAKKEAAQAGDIHDVMGIGLKLAGMCTRELLELSQNKEDYQNYKEVSCKFLREKGLEKVLNAICEIFDKGGRDPDISNRSIRRHQFNYSGARVRAMYSQNKSDSNISTNHNESEMDLVEDDAAKDLGEIKPITIKKIRIVQETSSQKPSNSKVKIIENQDQSHDSASLNNTKHQDLTPKDQCVITSARQNVSLQEQLQTQFTIIQYLTPKYASRGAIFAQHKSDPTATPVVVKYFDAQKLHHNTKEHTTLSFELFCNELTVSKNSHSNSVLQSWGEPYINTNTKQGYYVLPYATSLRQLLAKKHKVDFWKLFSNVVSAIEVMEAKGVIHYSLKPENIFCFANHSQDFYTVADWSHLQSLASERTQTETQVLESLMAERVTSAGRYAAPELQGNTPRHKSVSAKCSIYSLAVVLLEVLGMKFAEPKLIRDCLFQNNFSQLDAQGLSVILQRMLEREPTKRIDAQDLKWSINDFAVVALRTETGEQVRFMARAKGIARESVAFESTNSKIKSYLQYISFRF